jgi:hypothetical protein
MHAMDVPDRGAGHVQADGGAVGGAVGEVADRAAGSPGSGVNLRASRQPAEHPDLPRRVRGSVDSPASGQKSGNPTTIHAGDHRLSLQLHE